MSYRYKLLLLTLLLPGGKNSAQPPDSVVLNKRVMRGDLSGSYVTERNWWADAQEYLTVRGLAEARFRKKYAGGRQYEHYIHTQLGYASFPDSIWMKDADQLRVQLRWMNKGPRGGMHTWNVRFQTQWLSTWQYSETGRTWTAGFMNPAALEGGYAFSWDFLKNSNLMLTPAAFQLRVRPNKQGPASLQELPAITTRHADIYSRYGFSMSLNMEETFYKDVILLSHQSHLFCNAISAQQVQFECINRLCFRFLKYLQLRIDTSISYYPEQSLRLQYRQEVLVGIFYERRK